MGEHDFEGTLAEAERADTNAHRQEYAPTDMFGNDLTKTDSFGAARLSCKHCNRPFEQHWVGTSGVFCSSADLSGHKLFDNIVSEQRYEPAEPAHD